MGLAGASKKRKISHDPNNTAWTRSEGFGHRILSSQGWTPGTILGADPDNPHHTVASAVGVKVMLKDDTLGLGCKGSQEDTCTGLGDLQNLLGRLNGKTEEAVRDEENTRVKTLVAGRFGMSFVKGEVLESTWVTNELKREKMIEEEDVEMEDSKDTKTSKSKRSGKDEDKSKDKKKKKKDKKKHSGQSSEDEASASSSSSSTSDRKSDKAKRKEQKAAKKAEKLAKKERKEARRLRKEEKRKEKAEKKILASMIVKSKSSSSASTPLLTTLDSSSKPATATSQSLPISLPTSGTSTPITGRQALRSKWIAQKRMAVMDAKALNEILMIKA